MRQNYNPQFSSIKAECVVKGRDYAFTISPKQQYDDMDKDGEFRVKDRIRCFGHYSKKHLTRLKGSVYKLYLETSPLGRLHWHGILRITDVKEWLLRDIITLQALGSFCIKEIDDPDAWERYYLKQLDIWMGILYAKIESLLYQEHE